MGDKMTYIKKFELWSSIGTIIFGSMLHFVFAWSGNWKPFALIAAVNESTWEHLKLAFWPAFILAIIGYFTTGRNQQNFCFAQMKKLFIMPFLIIVLFYGWQFFFEDSLIYDILIFIVAIIAGHYAAYRLETGKRNYNLKTFSCIMIAILTLAFSLFTFYPPHNLLFKDPIGGGYGVTR